MVTSPRVSKGTPNSRSSTIKSGISNVEFEMKLMILKNKQLRI